MKRTFSRTSKSDMAQYRETIRSLLEEDKSFVEIAYLLNKDRSTILHIAKKYGLEPEGYVRRKMGRPSRPKPDEGEKVNQGKNYADYLAEQRDRRYNKLIGITK